MGKQQKWFITVCIFLFLSLVSQIHSTSHFNARKRVHSHRTKTNGINQKTPKEKDLIKRMPGHRAASFKQYGGYVSVNETGGRFFYYYFVEAINASASTPLVIWFNGGPGCSSLRGALTEHGPFRVHSNGKKLYRNPYSWNNEANMLYVESPSVVGFSYTNTSFSDEDYTDKMTTENNYMFLVNWLEKFPEFKGREFYIAGQSYAGHYVPLLAQKILHHKNQTSIDLRGIFIGNPGLDYYVMYNGNMQFAADYNLIPQELLAKYKKFCGWESYQTTVPNENIEPCLDTTMEIQGLTKDLDMYNIYAPLCLNSTLTKKTTKCTTVMKYEPCTIEYTKAYLNLKKVQKAIHANTTKLPYPWSECNDEAFQKWSKADTEAVMIPILQELMENNLRVVVYSGDIDSAVSVTATMMVLKKMNLTVEKQWRPWLSGGEVGGYTEDYKGNLKFVTVKGAGHSVPTDQPIHALNLFTSFIRNTPLPEPQPEPETNGL